MEKKADILDSVETRPLQSSVMMNSPKVSKFGSKAGFVIPRNKLSGSLVPIFRGSGKTSASTADATKEESNQLARRKTKWGPDPMEDLLARKGKILAYQTRLEQITELLKAGSLATKDDHEPEHPLESVSFDSSKDSAGESGKLSQLELEKREVIGEILRLNPSYKAPPDYKPLQKEDKVPVPIKAYPGYNFIVLLLGPESNALKRLEEETGVKVWVQGTKADTGEKKEITQSDLNEAQSTYEELYVHVSAETYEKVDAAVTLIELLITPVIANHNVSAANLTSSDGGVLDSSQKIVTSGFETNLVSSISQAAPQTNVPAPSAPLQYQPYPTPWYPPGSTNISAPPSSGYMPPPMQNNAVRYAAPPANVHIPHQSFASHPPFLQPPRNSPGAQAQHPPMYGSQRPLVPQNPNVMAVSQQQPAPHHNMHRPTSFPPATPSMPMGVMPPASRPPFSQMAQMGPTYPAGSMPNRPLMSPMPLGNSGWSGAASGTPPMRPSNVQMSPQVALQRPPAIAPQAMQTPQNLAPRTTGGPMLANQPMTSFSSQPSSVGAFSSAPMHMGPVPVVPVYKPGPVSVPTSMPNFPAALPPVSGSVVAPVSAHMPSSVQSTQPVLPQLRMPGPLVPPIQTSNPVLSPMPTAQLPMSTPGGPVSGSGPATGNSAAPLVSTPKLPRPSSSDFTFQPAGSPTAAALASSRPPNIQQSATFPPTQGLAGATQPQVAAPPPSPSFRPAMQNAMMPVGVPALPLQAPMNPSASSPAMAMNIVRHPPRPIFPNSPSMPIAPFNQQGQQIFPPLQSQGPGPALSRPPIQTQHPSQLPHMRPLQPLMIPGQQMAGNNVGFAPSRPAPGPGGNQTYDPFSPTSVPPMAHSSQDIRPNAGKTDSQVEYENLMASMGVK